MDLIKIKQELIRDEGLRLKPYVDTVGKMTIGVGRNLSDAGISETEAMYMLDKDITVACQELNKALPWWTGLSDARQRVLVNMVFNMGLTKFLTFKNTLAHIKAGEYIEAAAAMLASKWAAQVGQRAIRLSDMMRNG